MAEAERAPWWLVGGQERCRACLRRYALQVEVRCAACDHGLCAFCAVVVRETQERFCVDCVPADVAGEGA